MDNQKESLKKIIEKGKIFFKDIDDVITEELKGNETIEFLKSKTKDFQTKLEDLKEKVSEKVKKITTEEVFAKEIDNDLVIELIVNGLTKDNISIEIEDNKLLINIDDKNVNKEYRKHWSISKNNLFYDFTQYEESVLVENTTSKFENGILYITIPRKNKNNPIKRKITIL
jgi:HSP20 family molecular chaperone IbpA